jgi:hypothetical protein
LSSLAQIILNRQFSFLCGWVKTDRRAKRIRSLISGIKTIVAYFSSLSLSLPLLSSLSSSFLILPISYIHSRLSFSFPLLLHYLSCPISYFSLFPLFSVPSANHISSVCIFSTLFCHFMYSISTICFIPLPVYPLLLSMSSLSISFLVFSLSLSVSLFLLFSAISYLSVSVPVVFISNHLPLLFSFSPFLMHHHSCGPSTQSSSHTHKHTHHSSSILHQ